MTPLDPESPPLASPAEVEHVFRRTFLSAFGTGAPRVGVSQVARILLDDLAARDPLTIPVDKFEHHNELKAAGEDFLLLRDYLDNLAHGPLAQGEDPVQVHLRDRVLVWASWADILGQSIRQGLMEHHFRFIAPRGWEAGLVGQLLALPPAPEPPRPRRPYNLDDHVFRRSFLRLFANSAQQAALAQVGAMWCDSACELGECETVMGSVFVSELRALAEDLIGVYEMLMWSSQEPTRSTLSDVETRCAARAEQWAATLGALAAEMRSELEQPL